MVMTSHMQNNNIINNVRNTKCGNNNNTNYGGNFKIT